MKRPLLAVLFVLALLLWIPRPESSDPEESRPLPEYTAQEIMRIYDTRDRLALEEKQFFAFREHRRKLQNLLWDQQILLLDAMAELDQAATELQLTRTYISQEMFPTKSYDELLSRYLLLTMAQLYEERPELQFRGEVLLALKLEHQSLYGFHTLSDLQQQ